MRLRHLLAGAAMLAVSAGAASAATITVATVNNSDMIIMQTLSSQWEKADRQQDQLGGAGGERAAPARHHRHRHQGRAVRRHHHRQLRDADLGQAELARRRSTISPPPMTTTTSSRTCATRSRPAANSTRCRSTPRARFTFYRKDLFEKAGLTMPAKPTYDQIAQFADKLTDKAKEQYGICLRGKAGWGENMAFVDTLVNAFGARWFDMKWNPQLDLAGVEAGRHLLRRPDASRRPAGRDRQRVQREPGPVHDRPLRDVDRRDGRRRHGLRQGEEPGGRQDRLHRRAASR